jgi:anionic cell wall polymer biosynthesis LytR-Cps2A-Psr (LCP) family protein
VLVLVAMVAGGAAGGLYLYGHDFAAATAPHSKALRKATKHLDYVAPGKPAIALVLGTDHRYVDGKAPGRSDTMMLIRTDPASHTVSLLSFPRDMRVAIHCPGRSIWYDKINAAYPTCGPLGSLETVKALTNVPINYLISVNFLGFIRWSTSSGASTWTSTGATSTTIGGRPATPGSTWRPATRD